MEAFYEEDIETGWAQLKIEWEEFEPLLNRLVALQLANLKLKKRNNLNANN